MKSGYISGNVLAPDPDESISVVPEAQLKLTHHSLKVPDEYSQGPESHLQCVPRHWSII